ncbi:hypothetical protein GCM10027022_20770 [Alpinimonas psychrophila]
MQTNNGVLGEGTHPGWGFTLRENDAPSHVPLEAAEITHAATLCESVGDNSKASEADRSDLAELLTEWQHRGISAGQMAVVLKLPLASVNQMLGTSTGR